MSGLVARLPISMVGIGIVLLAEAETGSYAFAGVVSATALIANAAFSIVQGRLLDRLGQGRVLPIAITLWGLGLSGIMWSLLAEWPSWTTYACAALAGASLPSIGACVRARWSFALKSRPERLQSAFAFEAVADECVFMVGPIVVTVLATTVHATAGLIAALAVGLMGTYVFSALRSTEPPAHPASTRGAAPAAMPWRPLVPLTVVMVALGILVGAAEVATVAFSEEEGQQGAAGFLLALWSFGSLVAGLISGAITWRASTLTRLRWAALALAGTLAPLALAPSIPVMGVVLLASGFALSPTLIAAVMLAENVLPPARLTEGMAFLLQTGLAIGLAPGAAVAGAVIDAYGASPAYLVCFGGGLLAVAGTLLTQVPASMRSQNEESADAGFVA
ncbi:MFS transporter [Phytoactinopolyspora endophytica]|uniref:MFS transporter n=1 Tax=Phytoactinopolyspora endophytica TaxID=1642495 RepID=UPI00101B6DF9|nr:MFS transporter [Phytoactinopolyspora endophytica]